LITPTRSSPFTREVRRGMGGTVSMKIWRPIPTPALPLKGRESCVRTLCSDLHFELLVLVRVLLQIAVLQRIRRRALLDRFQDRELLVLHFHDVDIERSVVRLRLDLDQSGRTLDRWT